MKRAHSILIACLITAVGLILVGFLWQTSDITKIRNLDYKQYSRPIMQRDDHDIKNCLILVKKMLKDGEIDVLDQYQAANSIWEVIGQSHGSWLESTNGAKSKVRYD